jgi:hypothetical protein
MGGMNQKRPTAIECTMNHAKTSFSREIFAGAIISVAQFLQEIRALQSPFSTSVRGYPFLDVPRCTYHVPGCMQGTAGIHRRLTHA